MPDKLGHRLAMTRHERSLSQKYVAHEAKISQKHLCQIEKGHESVLSLASGTLRNLARVLQVTTDYLTGMDLSESELQAADAA